MRSLTGGDALALTEISTAQQLLLAQPDPDLTSLALTSVQRDHLSERNANIPTNLPAVWAKLGRLTRAEALAHSIPDPDSRAEALGLLADVVAAGGDPDRAETLIAQIPTLDSRAEMLIKLVQVVARGHVPGGFRLPRPWVAEEVDHKRAVRLLSEAETLTIQITNPDRQAELLIQLAEEADTSGDPDWADRLASEAETFIAKITNPDARVKRLSQLANVVVTYGDLDWAEALVAQVTDPDSRVELLIELVKEATESGDPDRAARLTREAETFIPQTANSLAGVMVLGRLMAAVAAFGDLDWAEALMEQNTDPDSQTDLLIQLAKEAVASGDPDRAEALIAQMTDPDSQAELWSQAAERATANGDLDRAEVLNARSTHPDLLAAQLSQVTRDDDDYEALIARSPLNQRAAMLSHAAEMAAHDDPDRAARLAAESAALSAQSTDPYSRAKPLCRLAEAVATSGDLDRAVWLIGEAEVLIAQLTDEDSRAEALGRLAEAAAACGDLEQAEALIAQIADPGIRARALGRLAMATARTPLVQEHPHGGSPTVVRARHLLGKALATGSWTDVASRLAYLAPPAVSALADELQVRWNLNGPADPRHNVPRSSDLYGVP
ncbi:MAG: hypothetical protein ACRDRI_19880 [Pseudonocardiaceae bacterium]